MYIFSLTKRTATHLVFIMAAWSAFGTTVASGREGTAPRALMGRSSSPKDLTSIMMSRGARDLGKVSQTMPRTAAQWPRTNHSNQSTEIERDAGVVQAWYSGDAIQTRRRQLQSEGSGNLPEEAFNGQFEPWCDDSVAKNTAQREVCEYDCATLKAHYYPGQVSRCFVHSTYLV
jgi:hypothetical protein